MEKIFNTSGDCKPDRHYMVNIQERLLEIKKMIDRGDYFCINRARQYGKTTTLRALRQLLNKEYMVISLDFQKEMSDAKFQNENAFSLAFANAFLRSVKECEKPDPLKKALTALEEEVRNQSSRLELVELFQFLSLICGGSSKPVVLMIDEVDSATNNQAFMM